MKRPDMSRFKRPELRMKVPSPLVDLFYDLHDRRLLPLVALVIVAIVAVPVLLGGGSKVPTEPVAVAPPPASGAEVGKLTVVRATPGLRDYRKRLSGRKPTDPFHQRFTRPVLKGAKLQTQTTTESTSTTTTTTTTADLPSSSTPPKSGSENSSGAGGADSDGAGAKSGGGNGSAKSSGYTIDVQIVHNGKKQTRRAVSQMTKLPGDKAPVVMFIGVTGGKSKKALLLVSSDVVSIFGDGVCSLGSESCDLLAVEPGFPETFVYGENKSRYRINVLKIHS